MNKPFSQDYVLRTTAKHMKRAVERSIDITLHRLPEFSDAPAKAREAFETLGRLHRMKKDVEAIIKNHPENSEEVSHVD